MRHGTDEQETLGKLVLPWSMDLPAGGKLAKSFWELTSIHDCCKCTGMWSGRRGGRGRRKLTNHMENFWETQTLKHRAHPKERSSSGNGAQGAQY